MSIRRSACVSIAWVTLPLTFGFMEMRRVYREAEVRKSVAADL